MALKCSSIHRILRILLAVAAVMVLPRAAFSADEKDVPAPGLQVNGSLSLRYWYRTTDLSTHRVSDQDAIADLRLNATGREESDPELHFLGSVRSDLDGEQSLHPYFPLEDINNTHDRRATAEVYEAYAVLNNPLRSDLRARLGRQPGTRDEQITFDGVAADAGMANGKVNVTVYGGVAVHFQEVNTHWGEDSLQGAGIDLRLLPSTGMSADYLLVSDRQEYLSGRELFRDRLLAFKAWRRFAQFAQVSASYRFLDGDPRDLSVKASAVLAAQDAEMTASYYRQLKERAELTNEFAPVSFIMGSSSPYQSLDLKARKFFGERLALDAGYFKRLLLDGTDAGPFNKEYSRSYLSSELRDLFIPGLSWTLTGEVWQAGGASTDSYGTDLAYAFRARGRKGRVAAGTYYSLYKYDYYLELGEREKVRTYYLEGRQAVADGVSLHARYEYERGIEEYQTLRVGMRYEF